MGERDGPAGPRGRWPSCSAASETPPWRSRTKAAAIRFQGDRKLWKDGVVGAKTWGALDGEVTADDTSRESALTDVAINVVDDGSSAAALAHDPSSESALREVLGAASSFDDFVERLEAAGYRVQPA